MWTQILPERGEVSPPTRSQCSARIVRWWLSRGDLEFVRYYNLLAPPVTAFEDRVVPREPDGLRLVEGPDCGVSVRMSFTDTQQS